MKIYKISCIYFLKENCIKVREIEVEEKPKTYKSVNRGNIYKKEDNGIVTVTINMPKRRNAMSPITFLEIWYAIDAMEKDEILNSLIDSFFYSTFDYVSNPDFPKRYILRQYKENLRRKSWYPDYQNE